MAVMCRLCEGVSLDQLLAEEQELIETYGFVTRGVQTRDPRHQWSYTIGLLQNYGHAELVMLGKDSGTAHEVFTHLAQRIKDGENLERRKELMCCRNELLVVPVARRHLKAGLMNSWYEHRDEYGPFDLHLRAVQLVTSDDTRCAHHQRSQPLLDRADPSAWNPDDFIPSRPGSRPRPGSQQVVRRRRPKRKKK